ncbi:MAG: 50S ribosomal protein L24 [Elusimicrobiota bacterium]
MRKIKTGDEVVVKKGVEKGKTGEVIKIYPEKNRAIVSKLNVAKKHTMPSQKSPGGVIEQEAPIAMPNLQLICPKCSKPTKVNFDFLEDGEKVRICKKCGEIVV